MIDYTYQYRTVLDIRAVGGSNWDIFISAFNPSERVIKVFDEVRSARKHWLVHHEYGLGKSDVPEGAFISNEIREDDVILEFFTSALRETDLSGARICIDVTGFMRPHMIYLINYLRVVGVSSFDVIYTEPGHYSGHDRTRFASELVHDVRQVAGYEGFINNVTDNDLLVIGAGYEDSLIAEVAEEKGKAHKALIYGLPSLQADMYQQNVLRSYAAADALGDVAERVFAPASDPFATATVLSELIAREDTKRPITNLFLSPLSTKPQALGFALFYLRECTSRAASIIFPFSDSYSIDTSSRIGRIWKYEVELS
ncbi:hypothetical protein IG197_05180 [Aminobacter sp. SR38]|jgi:hypothetical protein|uniref:hypothetical protein n=1 Tax=Aminobacter sp. SR38 TaxID=2774562 RepID=UPI00177A8F6A|nr:hypothetical protein [Aminobacter sp. SR38]QOF72472.1 hypothetical protein IG197_05180 [Aminobacter sp. SR38]